MGIAQIALDPLLRKQANVEKKSAPNHPGKPLHPQATWEKSAPNPSGKPSHPQAMWGKNALNHSGKPLHPPFPFIGYIWKQHISKMGFPNPETKFGMIVV